MNSITEIKKGFNQGYDLKRLHPELAHKLYEGFSNHKQPSEYQKAFMKGFDQAEIEKPKSAPKKRNFILDNPNKPSQKGRDKNKELGDLDK